MLVQYLPYFIIVGLLSVKCIRFICGLRCVLLIDDILLSVLMEITFNADTDGVVTSK
jgi:hypothetical protein